MMDKKTLTETIKQMAIEMGADMIGVAPVSRYDGAPHMLTPQAHLPEAKSVVCLGVHHPDASVDWCGEPNPNYPAAFQIGMIPKLDAICFRLSKFLEEQGYPTIPQPCTTYWRHRYYKDIPYEHAASWSHMSAFVACGLGEYGYHGMVMSPEYGVRERVISFITSAELEPDPLYNGDPLCDNCKACARHCIGQNYGEDRLNDPQYIEFTIEGKTFKYPNINRWRCFYGEQAHLDTNYLAPIDDMDEEKIYEAIETVPHVKNYGYMCASFKHCMTPKKRTWDRQYTKNPRRKKELSPLTNAQMWERVKELALRAGADMITVQRLSDFEAQKENFHEGFRVDQFYDHFKTVIVFGRFVHKFESKQDAEQHRRDTSEANVNISELEQRNWRHMRDATVDRLSAGVIDITRYLDDLGHEAIQDWFMTGISRAAAKNAGWEKDGKHAYLGGIITDIDFDLIETERLREWDDEIGKTVTKDLPFMKNMDMVTVGRVSDITYPGMDAIRKAYPFAKSLVVLAEEIPERLTELACNQEAECGAAYAFAHYEVLKEGFWAACDLCDTLEAKGYKAVPLGDLAPTSEMTINKFGRHMPDLRANSPFAAAAGLGSLGKSGLVMNEKCGPRMRFVFVLTDAEFEPTSLDKRNLCPAGCKECASACPMQALLETMETVEVKDGESYEVMTRDETRCTWARSLAMCEGAGSDQLGWKLPDLKVPDLLTPEVVEEVIQKKDKIQTLAYRSPFFIDIIIERCLQACPVAKKYKK